MTTAKRLLVGLHERLWHTPAGDFCNLLRRAGLPQPVITLAAEAVQSCVVCRTFVRLPNRPQVRAGGATILQRDGTVRLVPPGRRHLHDPAGRSYSLQDLLSS